MDVVHMGDATTWDGKRVDSCLVVVDRHSGWIQAYPVAKKGLTAKMAAYLMYHNWFCCFGVPRTICSDLGAQFKAAWWRTFCALLGVHHAKAISYFSRSNGRAEKACGQLLDKLRKLHQEKKQSWTEALPKALQLLHDVVGPSGVSPYTSLFGRERTYGGLPLPEDHWAEDAIHFVQRMSDLDAQVQKTLEELHKQQENEEEKLQTFVPGQKVWVLRPRSGDVDKMSSWWCGPCEVLQQLSTHTYRVQVGRSRTRDCHVNQLKAHHADSLGRSWPLWYTSQTAVDAGDDVMMDEFNVEKVVRHKMDKKGNLLFLVHWEGCSQEEDTWENPEAFLPRFCQPWADYIKKNKLHIDVGNCLGKR